MIGYTRVSTTEQASAGNGLNAQEEACETPEQPQIAASADSDS